MYTEVSSFQEVRSTWFVLFYIIYCYFRPSPPTPGKIVPTTPTDSVPFYLPDHVGGYKFARSTFAAVESRYGLRFRT